MIEDADLINIFTPVNSLFEHDKMDKTSHIGHGTRRQNETISAWLSAKEHNKTNCICHVILIICLERKIS